MKNTITVIFLVLCLLFCLWFIASYIDIISDNLSINPQHYDWNLFVMMGGK